MFIAPYPLNVFLSVFWILRACSWPNLGRNMLLLGWSNRLCCLIDSPFETGIDFFFFTMAQQPPVGQGLLVIKDSRSHSNTPRSVGLLWTSDRPDAETSSWQHTTLTTHPCPGGIRTHNRSKRAAVDPRLRPRGHWDRRYWFTWPYYYVHLRLITISFDLCWSSLGNLYLKKEGCFMCKCELRVGSFVGCCF